ncbi:hypothetical protein [Arcobacter sp.]|uniref:hypothetical protein n=1 Tax=Arcobacter sp. TaxID=1872629 RepID=UPI003C785B9B
MIDDKLNKLEKKISKQKKEIKKLKEEINSQKEISKKMIEEEVTKTIFHHAKSMQHRIDQFIFDAKIQLKNNKL